MGLGCNSGQDAAGRIEVHQQATTEEAVEIMVAVRPREGVQTCSSNPATPYTLTLDDPIGQRRVLDTSLCPLRPLEVAPADLYQVD
ncbi:hypothetical protein DVS28_a1090 [Euzebya pacifica]|uniref:Uncharacterized protein n=1 Tax=Euzebya pacifica TaxID=1608957 RepID=A0A346XU94_9ACTN|nr:hypothetical protein [Euzebya pacifica]AXV05791.1 hypothetical protein DVS28_a1090 [Euzebya pacifica]